MPWRITSEPTTKEKVIGGLSYFTFGMAGLLYILLSKGSSQSQQFRFHFYQSVLLWIISMLVGYAAAPLFEILFGLLGLMGHGVVSPIATVVGAGATILGVGFKLLLLYGAIMAFLGKFAEVPFISNVVRNNMRY